MLITITRTNRTQDGTFGNLSIDTNSFKCVTLENTALIIPAGTYPIQWLWSDHFMQFMPHVMNVAGRIAIEQHWANFPQQLEGCIALGTEKEVSADCIDEAKEAWIQYAQIIINEPNVMLKIVEDFGNN